MNMKAVSCVLSGILFAGCAVQDADLGAVCTQESRQRIAMDLSRDLEFFADPRLSAVESADADLNAALRRRGFMLCETGMCPDAIRANFSISSVVPGELLTQLSTKDLVLQRLYLVKGGKDQGEESESLSSAGPLSVMHLKEERVQGERVRDSFERLREPVYERGGERTAKSGAAGSAFAAMRGASSLEAVQGDEVSGAGRGVAMAGGKSAPVVTTRQGVSKAVTARSVAEEPVKARPVNRAPVTARPVTEMPLTSDPVTARSVTAMPRISDPVTARPLTSDPVTARPVTARPEREGASVGSRVGALSDTVATARSLQRKISALRDLRSLADLRSIIM